MYKHTWGSVHTKQYIYGELYTHKVEEANKEKKFNRGRFIQKAKEGICGSEVDTKKR